MNKRIASLLAATLLATAALAQREGSLWWGHHHANGVPDGQLGVSKATVYEAALHIDGSTAPVQGGTISAVRLPFQGAAHIDSLTLWLATSLGREDLASIPVGRPAEGWNVVRLETPVSIPDTGLYVGYTFRVTELDGQSERPLVVCDDYTTGGLNLRVASVKAYADWYTTTRYGSLALQVELASPTLEAHSVSLLAVQQNNVVAQQADTMQLAYANYGTAGAQSLQYDYAFGDEQFSGTHTLSQPLPRVWGAQGYCTVPIQAPTATGRLPLSCTLTGVDDTANPHAQRAVQTTVLSLQQKTRHRTVMEEYTGTWCSACPRGFAGIARLKAMYPDDFIAVSVHVLNGDPMDVYYDYYYVMNATQFPSCRFDRGELTDPYDGDLTDGHFHADQNFRAAHALMAPADLSVSAQWEGDTVCAIISTTTFAFSDDMCRYRLAYVMTEDSLRGPEGDHAWHQRNSFSDPSMAYYVEEDMQQYVNATGSMIDDVAYNDVVLSMSPLRGIEGSLGASQVAGVPVSHSYRLGRTAVSQHRENIHIVCMLIDTETGRIANAAICTPQDPAGIQKISNLKPQISERYDLQGRRLADSPRRGIAIERQADGAARKVLLSSQKPIH